MGMVSDIVLEELIHFFFERVCKELIAGIQKLHPLGADLGGGVGHLAGLRDLFSCVKVQRPKHAGRAEQTCSEHIRLALDLGSCGEGLGACELPLDKFVPQEDVTELVRNGEARAFNACTVVINDIPLIVAKERKTAFVRCELVGVAVLDHADPGILGNLQDVHRETVGLVVDQALPSGAAKIFVSSVIQKYHLGDSVCYPGGGYVSMIGCDSIELFWDRIDMKREKMAYTGKKRNIYEMKFAPIC